MSEMDLILHIMCNVPQEYNTEIKICDEGIKNGSLTIKELRRKLNARYKRLQARDGNEDEKGLLGRDYNRNIEYKHCGKRGHISEKCLMLPKNKVKFDEFYNNRLRKL